MNPDRVPESIKPPYGLVSLAWACGGAVRFLPRACRSAIPRQAQGPCLGTGSRARFQGLERLVLAGHGANKYPGVARPEHPSPCWRRSSMCCTVLTCQDPRGRPRQPWGVPQPRVFESRAEILTVQPYALQLTLRSPRLFSARLVSSSAARGTPRAPSPCPSPSAHVASLLCRLCRWPPWSRFWGHRLSSPLEGVGGEQGSAQFCARFCPQHRAPCPGQLMFFDG